MAPHQATRMVEFGFGDLGFQIPATQRSRLQILSATCDTQTSKRVHLDSRLQIAETDGKLGIVTSQVFPLLG